MKTIIIVAVLLALMLPGFGGTGSGTIAGKKGTVPLKQINKPVVFQVSYGTTTGISDFSASCIQQTSDGGYISTGYTSDFGAGDDDILLLKSDSAGGLVWSATFGGLMADDGNFVVQTMDGGYAIASVTLSFMGENISLVKTDATGAMKWSKLYGTGTSESDASAACLQQTKDHGYILTGYISNYGAGMDDYYLVKTDSSGNIKWTKTYGGAMNDDAYSVAQTNDGGYIIAGTSSSFGDTLGDIYLVRTDSLGNKLWESAFGAGPSDASDHGMSVKVTSDNSFIVAGVTISATQGEYGDLLKIDSAGNLIWAKFYGTGTSSSDVSFSSVAQTSDSGFIAAGYTSNFGGGNDDFLLVKTNSHGDTLWTRAYGSGSNDDANFVTLTADSGFIVAGVSVGAPDSGEVMTAVKTDRQGNTSCLSWMTNINVDTALTMMLHRGTGTESAGGIAQNAPMNTSSGGLMIDDCLLFGVNEIQQGKSDMEVTAYPNPSSGPVTISLSQDTPSPVVEIYNTLGIRIVYLPFTGREVILNRSSLESGIYYYKVQNESGVIGSGKIILR